MVGSSMAALESNEILLDVKDLQVHFDVRRGTVRALEGVNFTVRRGSTMGIIGESGSGKSVTARAIMHLLAKNGRIVNGEILYYREAPEGNLASSEVIDISQQKANGPLMRSVRGGEIAMIFQEPMSSLTPVYTAGLH
jgi:ABC-type dipeptide/oligopeptide/nickel transport system ATPase component